MAVKTMYFHKNDRSKPEFSPALFWDIHIENIDYEKETAFVLERVFERGIENDEKEAVRYYNAFPVVSIRSISSIAFSMRSV
jgi:hypothetical protein